VAEQAPHKFATPVSTCLLSAGEPAGPKKIVHDVNRNDTTWN
jgi:hypothetical protein